MSSTMDQIASALRHLDAHDRDGWVQMGMAVKSELGEAGFTLWDDWSRTADNYQPKAAKSVWKSINPGGRVTIASLFAQAIQHGYRPEQPYQPPSSEERAKLGQERADAFSDFYLPVTPESGRLLYTLVRAARPARLRTRPGVTA